MSGAVPVPSQLWAHAPPRELAHRVEEGMCDEWEAVVDRYTVSRENWVGGVGEG